MTRNERYIYQISNTSFEGWKLQIAGFGAYFIGNVAAIDVARWRDDLAAERYAPKTVGHHLRALSALLNFAQRELSIQLPAGNPVAGVRKPKEDQPRERRFKPGEREALLAACQNLDQTAVVELAAETSMRRSELVGLRWEHVDLQRRTAHLIRPARALAFRHEARPPLPYSPGRPSRTG
ncbi:tyrosine recombinase XerC [mine drainage metagenome]|uniref:Tyrosine recombinase XerC n=1 Tax=mine drainage metagenome TaxID=410659 RepID=A0A1J5PTS4_9ZZZZ